MGFVDNDLIKLDSGVHPPDVGVVSEGRKLRVTTCLIYHAVKYSPPPLCDNFISTHGLMLSMSLKPSGVEQPECVARYCEVFSLVQVI